MQLTRRGYGVVGVAATLVLAGVIGARPLALVGAGTLFTWVLVALWQASTRFVETDERLSLKLSSERRQIQPDEDATLSVSISDAPVSYPVTVHVEWPVGVDGDDETVRVPSGQSEASTELPFSIPLAGEYSLPELTCEYQSADGLYRQTVPRGEALPIAASPSPSDVHVGTSGDPVTGSYGEHNSQQTGPGVDLVNIREYIPGDAVNHIDWNATARLNQAHVREFESEATRKTRIFIDNRMCLWEGPDGGTKADYLREVVLSILNQVARTGDPVGMTIVDDGGMRTDLGFEATRQRYQDCRQLVSNLSTPSTDRVAAGRPTTTSSADAHRNAQRLAGRGDRFAAAVRPFFDSRDAYVKRLESRPLYETFQTKRMMEQFHGWTVLCTDDTNPQETRAAVKTAVENGGYATVFVAPSALFEAESANDDDRAYGRLVDFETFRRSLDAIPNARAYEVAPELRLRSVLDAGRAT